MRNQNVRVFVCSVSYYYYGCVHIWVCRQWCESNLWLAAFPSKSGLFVAVDATGDYRMLPAGKIFRPDEKVKPERVWILNWRGRDLEQDYADYSRISNLIHITEPAGYIHIIYETAYFCHCIFHKIKSRSSNRYPRQIQGSLQSQNKVCFLLKSISFQVESNYAWAVTRHLSSITSSLFRWHINVRCRVSWPRYVTHSLR